MPKPKPTSIVRHEIVLGSAERQIARDIQTAYSINRIASPLTNMSASGFVLAGGTAIVLIDYLLDHLGLEFNWREIIEDMTPEQVHDWLESQNLIFGGIGAILGLLLTGGNPYGAAAGGVAGGVVAEGFEEADAAVASIFPEEWLPYLPPWAQPASANDSYQRREVVGTVGGRGTGPDPEAAATKAEARQKSARGFAFSLMAFRRFLREGGP